MFAYRFGLLNYVTDNLKILNRIYIHFATNLGPEGYVFNDKEVKEIKEIVYKIACNASQRLSEKYFGKKIVSAICSPPKWMCNELEDMLNNNLL